MKVIVCEFSQETNSFSSIISKRSDFSPWCAANSKKEITGFYDVMKEAGYEVFYGPMYRAQASGKVMHEVVEEFLSDTVKAIDEAGGVGAICLALHGATQSTSEDDVCGYVTQYLKDKYNVPVGVSLDLHANITHRFFEVADSLSAYQTYPHRDAYETGRRSATTLLKVLRKEPFYKAIAFVPMIVPASGYTTDDGPFHDLVQKAHALVNDGKLYDYTITCMQPWLDVKEGASSVYAVSASKEEAEKAVLALAQEMSGIYDSMQPSLDSYEDVVAATEANDSGKPVVVSDFSDSPNAGAMGDNIALLKLMLENGTKKRCAFIVNDVSVVEKAFAVGIGGKSVFKIGGSLSNYNNDSIELEATVCSLHDGHFLLEGPMMRGFDMNAGHCAVFRAGSIDVLVCEHMVITGDIQLYRHFGIEPTLYDMVMVKANTSFRISYGPLASKIMVVDTGCASTANLKDLPWTHLPKKGMYPFEEIKDTYKAIDNYMSKASN